MRIYYFIITHHYQFCVSLQAQNNANKFKQQAQSSFTKTKTIRKPAIFISGIQGLRK